jgi:D-amino-acid dehydrogenase
MLDASSPFYVRPTLNRERLGWLIRFARAATQERSRAGAAALSALLIHSAGLFERDLSPRPDLDLDFRADGVMNVYESEKSLSEGLQEAEGLSQLGVISRALDRAEVAELEPSLTQSVAGGILWPQDGHLDPSRFLSQLAASLERRGAQICWSTELLSLDLEHGRLGSLETTRGAVEAKEVVLAAGAWSPLLSDQLGLRLPVQPGKGYSITFDSPGALPARPLLFADARVVATPLASRLRLAGTLELVGLDPKISARRVNAIRAVGRHFLPGLEGARAEIWRGLRPLSADGLPIVGRSRNCRNLTVATGHGHLGLSLGPITGQIVSSLVAGSSPPVDITALRLERF